MDQKKKKWKCQQIVLRNLKIIIIFMKEGCKKKISLIGKDIAKLNKSISNF